jgi:hypothetical protein
MNECVCYSMLSVFMPVLFPAVSMGVCVRARVACSSLANHSMPPLPQGGAHCAPRHYIAMTHSIVTEVLSNLRSQLRTRNAQYTPAYETIPKTCPDTTPIPRNLPWTVPFGAVHNSWGVKSV